MSYIEKFWRQATAADVTRVMTGEEVEARFSDVPNSVWSKVTQLVGAKRINDTGTVWLSPSSDWRYCQVYSPPQWFLDKPEPGEGYRLLGKFPDEPVQGGDFRNDDGTWTELRNDCKSDQWEGYWYRRKIEQPKPEPKHYTLQVGDTADVPSGEQLTVLEYGIAVNRALRAACPWHLA